MKTQRFKFSAVILLSLCIAFTTTSCKKKGCTDIHSINYDPAAKVDDGSCIDRIVGCLDETSINYDPNANYAGDCAAAKKKQKSLFMKFTGTWCFACGDYGAKIVKDIELATDPKDVLILELHTGGDPMNSVHVDNFKNYFTHTASPSFVHNSDMIGNGVSVGQVSSDIGTMGLQSPIIGAVAILKPGSGNKYTVEVEYEVFENVTGDYYLATYISEDGFVYPQIGKDGSAHPEWDFDTATKKYPEYIHTNTLRDCATENIFGESIIAGSASAGDKSQLKYSMTKGSNWTDNIYVHVVIWKKAGNDWEFVNAY